MKYGSVPPPKFTLLPDEPDGEFLEVDGPVSKDCIDWWNGADETTRLVWLAWSHSADPRKAFEAYKAAKAAAARQVEDAQAAERRTYQNIVAKARAAKTAAAGAASRVGTNGAGPDRHY
jgi:hypothetical protein